MKFLTSERKKKRKVVASLTIAFPSFDGTFFLNPLTGAARDKELCKLLYDPQYRSNDGKKCLLNQLFKIMTWQGTLKVRRFANWHRPEEHINSTLKIFPPSLIMVWNERHSPKHFALYSNECYRKISSVPPNNGSTFLCKIWISYTLKHLFFRVFEEIIL